MVDNYLITVCICTYKRTQFLQHLLEKIQEQITQQLFSYAVLIVDNDVNKSAENVIHRVKTNSNINIEYYCEPVQNIALARNMAVKNAKSNYIVFIDDDEYPHKEWLLNLFNTCIKFRADGVLGPVKPHFDSDPPSWILRGRICERKSFETGTVLTNPSDTRTGNVLLKREIFDSGKYYFNTDFGRFGGEDVDFFRRTISSGKKYVWCDEAPVFEHVPADRLTKTYYIRRALLRGKVAASYKLSAFQKIVSILKSLVAILIYTTLLPITTIFGLHVFMKYLIKFCDHFGKLMATIGIQLVKER